MADVNRKTVDYLVLHHAVTPTWEDKSKDFLINWFSDNGFARAYGSNSANWSGLKKPNGQRSYSQAHFAGQRVTSKTPDATADERKKGYRLVQLVQDVWGQITWHAGNWDINTRSIGIENLGDYRTISLRENDCKVIADFWRAQDRKLKGNTAIVGHKEVSDSATACPANIMNSRNRIVTLVNASSSGWPKDPTITTKNETVTTSIPYETETVDDPNLKKGTQEIRQKGVNGTRTVVTKITLTDGKETKREVVSDTTVPPVTLIMAIGSYVEPDPEPVDPPTDPVTPPDVIDPPVIDPEKPSGVNFLITLLKKFIELLKKIWNA